MRSEARAGATFLEQEADQESKKWLRALLATTVMQV